MCTENITSSRCSTYCASCYERSMANCIGAQGLADHFVIPGTRYIRGALTQQPTVEQQQQSKYDHLDTGDKHGVYFCLSVSCKTWAYAEAMTTQLKPSPVHPYGQTVKPQYVLFGSDRLLLFTGAAAQQYCCCTLYTSSKNVPYRYTGFRYGHKTR